MSRPATHVLRLKRKRADGERFSRYRDLSFLHRAELEDISAIGCFDRMVEIDSIDDAECSGAAKVVLPGSRDELLVERRLLLRVRLGRRWRDAPLRRRPDIWSHR